MNKITDFNQVNQALAGYIPKSPKLTKENINLDRMIPLMKILDNPEKKLKVIHIAGTSGKTSTAYFISELLSKSGLKVGLTVSPYVDNINERVQINNKPLLEKDFCAELTEFMNIIDGLAIKPSYFELLCAFSFWVFEKEKVDYAVIETGLGGLLDATNVAQREDKLCVITDIGYDHMHILGNTLEKIARQKAGIIHQDNEVIMYNQPENIIKVFKDKVAKIESRLILVNEDEISGFEGTLINKDIPKFQKRNWYLAYQAYLYLLKRDGIKEVVTDRLIETQNTLIPARMETVVIDSKTIIMDGAHNQQKMLAFINSFEERYPGQKAAILIALKNDKDFKAIPSIFKNITTRIITTNFDTSQNLIFKSIPAQELAKEFEKHKIKNISAINDQHEAYLSLINGPEDICIITGSFYLISRLRKIEDLG